MTHITLLLVAAAGDVENGNLSCCGVVVADRRVLTIFTYFL
jgi:hypothetical protein